MKLSFVIACFFFCNAYGQDVSGLYAGTLINDSLKMVQNYELALSEYKGKITGYSYITFVAKDTFYYNIKRIKATKENGKLIVQDVAMLYHNHPKGPDKGVHLINVISLPAQDTITDLKGLWKTTESKKHGFYSISGNLDLGRDNDSSHSALIHHLKELGVIAYQEEKKTSIAKNSKKQQYSTAAEKTAATTGKSSVEIKPESSELKVEQRKTSIAETIIITSDSLTLSFYDNGVVDGDTISVFLNGENIVSKAKLTAVASKQVVRVASTEEKDLVLTLVAENLGSIPPNTGLLIIEDGDQKHQVRFSADMETNAAIILKRKRR